MSNTIPIEWELSTLESNARLITDGAHASPPTYENGRPIATVQNMRSRAIDVSSCRLISEGDFDALTKGNCSPEINDVLFSKDGTVGKTFVFRQNERIVLLSSIAIIRLHIDRLDPEFCSQFLLSPLFYHELENAKSGSAIRRIVLNDLKKIELPTPPIPEQRKIADVLSSVDDVIEKTRAQIDKLKDLKIGMMQELLTKGIGNTEFKESPVGRIPAEWTVLRVADFLSERKQKGIEGLPIYSVLMEGGMVPRNTVERRVPSELESNDNRLVKHGDLAYNMMRMWQGASGIAAVDCLVSPAYVVCTPSDIIDSDFLGYLLKDPASIQMLRRYSQGLTGDRLRLYFEHFKLMSFAIPPIEEQRRIGNMLKSVDESITKKSLQLSAQQTLKRALMQSLLTGKVRVNVSKQETAAA